LIFDESLSGNEFWKPDNEFGKSDNGFWKPDNGFGKPDTENPDSYNKNPNPDNGNCDSENKMDDKNFRARSVPLKFFLHLINMRERKRINFSIKGNRSDWECITYIIFF